MYLKIAETLDNQGFRRILFIMTKSFSHSKKLMLTLLKHSDIMRVRKGNKTKILPKNEAEAKAYD